MIRCEKKIKWKINLQLQNTHCSSNSISNAFFNCCSFLDFKKLHYIVNLTFEKFYEIQKIAMTDNNFFIVQRNNFACCCAFQHLFLNRTSRSWKRSADFLSKFVFILTITVFCHDSILLCVLQSSMFP